MFFRTPRLLLRPAWPDDAEAVASLAVDAQKLPSLSNLEWLDPRAGARSFVARESVPTLPSLLIFARTAGAPLLLGACGLRRRRSGTVEFGIWLARVHAGHGFATEAGRGLMEIAKTLRLGRIEASHDLNDPALARVLGKLGFTADPAVGARPSGSPGEATSAYRLWFDLVEQTSDVALAA